MTFIEAEIEDEADESKDDELKDDDEEVEDEKDEGRIALIFLTNVSLKLGEA